MKDCSNCKLCYKLQKLDYSQGGCIHTDMDGYICMVFADEGIANWMVGHDMYAGFCEMFTPKEKENKNGID